MMNEATGRMLDVKAHITQSINDILWTRFGTRIQREEYGSFLPDLIDQPLNETTRLRVAAATIMALAKWEPRISVKSVRVTVKTETQPGLSIAIEAIMNDRVETFIVGEAA